MSEHVDYPHRLLDECLRVARRHVIVALPNNWPGFFWNLVAGHNVVHRAGHGLPLEEPPPGQRHKWFFNIEEAAAFMGAPAAARGARVVTTDCVFEPSGDSLLRVCAARAVRPARLPRRPRRSSQRIMAKAARPGPALFSPPKFAFAVPLSWAEEVVKRIVGRGAIPLREHVLSAAVDGAREAGCSRLARLKEERWR